MSACLGKISKIPKLFFATFCFPYTHPILPCALCTCSSHTELLHKTPFNCAVSLFHFIAHRLRIHSCSLKCTKHTVNIIQKFGEGMQQEKTSVEKLKHNREKMNHWYFPMIATHRGTATSTSLAFCSSDLPKWKQHLRGTILQNRPT